MERLRFDPSKERLRSPWPVVGEPGDLQLLELPDHANPPSRVDQILPWNRGRFRNVQAHGVEDSHARCSLVLRNGEDPGQVAFGLSLLVPHQVGLRSYFFAISLTVSAPCSASSVTLALSSAGCGFPFGILEPHFPRSMSTLCEFTSSGQIGVQF